MDTENDSQHVLYVCITCKAENLNMPQFQEEGAVEVEGETQGEKLYHLIKKNAGFQQTDLKIIPTKCLSTCKRGCAMALASSLKYSYILGEIDPSLLLDLSIMIETYKQSKDGVLKKIHRPESLQKKVVARIPPLSS